MYKNLCCRRILSCKLMENEPRSFGKFLEFHFWGSVRTLLPSLIAFLTKMMSRGVPESGPEVRKCRMLDIRQTSGSGGFLPAGTKCLKTINRHPMLTFIYW